MLVDIGALPGHRVAHPASSPRVVTLFTAYEQRVCVRANALFSWLLAIQCAGAVAVAHWLGAPLAPAVALGALCSIPAITLTRFRPCDFVTRAVVALSQVGFSLLFIQLSGGRIETHFHVFASLALLVFYRDFRLLPLAVGVVILFHLAGGWWRPQMMFGEPEVSLWRTVEHAAWLSFEGAGLWWVCVVSRRNIWEMCERQEQHEQLLEGLEQRVRERTHALESEMVAREKAAAALRENEQHHRELVSRIPIGVFESTRSGKVNLGNPHLLSLVGLPSAFDARMLSLADGRIFPVADHERLWHLLENQREVRGFSTRLRHFDGSFFDVVINAQLKPGEDAGELVAEGTVEDVTVRKRAERELEALHGQLVLASRQAGMAEVATGVLHNVGNVLTSVNLIVHDVQDRLKNTRLVHLHRAVEILQREREHLGEFMANDPTGRQLPDFLAKLDQYLGTENQQVLADVEGLVRHFEHIREIIITQQGSAQLFGVIETMAPAQLFEDALRLNAESLQRHNIVLERVFQPSSLVKADRHKVLQILVNLLKNAKDALQTGKTGERRIRVRVAPAPGSRVALAVEDNGPGIAPENLTRIFQHGYTTKQNGHGFGLHTSVLSAREMGGDLVATSAGEGRGATFTLTVPAAGT